jgi:hypothetical protein
MNSGTKLLLLLYRVNFLLMPFAFTWLLFSCSSMQDSSTHADPLVENINGMMLHIQAVLGIALLFVPDARRAHTVLITFCSLVGEFALLVSVPMMMLPLLVFGLLAYPVNAKELYTMFLEFAGRNRVLGCGEHAGGMKIKPVALSPVEAILVPALAFLIAGGAVLNGFKYMMSQAMQGEMALIRSQVARAQRYKAAQENKVSKPVTDIEFIENPPAKGK